MGANMTRRLIHGGHTLVVSDLSAEAVKGLAAQGAVASSSLDDLVGKLTAPRVAWIMVPSGDPTEKTVQALLRTMQPGDTIIDGGNSNYRDTQRRAKAVAQRQIHYVDSGTSGGVWGLKEGYSLMIGGDEAVVERLRPIFETLAPAPGRGWGRVGAVGSGHYTKMIHNGIEYGLMQAYAEGFSILKHKSEFELDLHQIAEIWRFGSVVRSWLLDLAADALDKNPTLKGIAPYVADSGEGRWTVFEAIDLNVSAPIITESLIRRIRSREENNFTDRMVSIQRNAFGGHAVKKD
jgi:6-phosphogluconate dehydrogenase